MEQCQYFHLAALVTWWRIMTFPKFRVPLEIKHYKGPLTAANAYVMFLTGWQQNVKVRKASPGMTGTNILKVVVFRQQNWVFLFLLYTSEPSKYSILNIYYNGYKIIALNLKGNAGWIKGTFFLHLHTNPCQGDMPEAIHRFPVTKTKVPGWRVWGGGRSIWVWGRRRRSWGQTHVEKCYEVHAVSASQGTVYAHMPTSEGRDRKVRTGWASKGRNTQGAGLSPTGNLPVSQYIKEKEPKTHLLLMMSLKRIELV